MVRKLREEAVGRGYLCIVGGVPSVVQKAMGSVVEVSKGYLTEFNLGHLSDPQRERLERRQERKVFCLAWQKNQEFPAKVERISVLMLQMIIEKVFVRLCEILKWQIVLLKILNIFGIWGFLVLNSRLSLSILFIFLALFPYIFKNWFFS